MSLNMPSSATITQPAHTPSWAHFYYEHTIAASLGWRRLWQQPYQTLGAVLLIGLSLALVVFFALGLKATETWRSNLRTSSQMMIFPDASSKEYSSDDLQQRLLSIGLVTQVDYHEPVALMEELLSEKIPHDLIPQVPGIYTLQTSVDISLPKLLHIKEEIESWPHVEKVEIDQIWHIKISQILKLLQVMSTLIGFVLLASAILVINYSIKMVMDRYQQEIAILYHLGATSYFIQRPYLYQGFFLGMFGVSTAIIALSGSFLSVRDQIESLQELYRFSLLPNFKEQAYIALGLAGILLFATASSYIATKKWLTVFQTQARR
jgi:cell division transport system permease protein